jgi:hypothetical protein
MRRKKERDEEREDWMRIRWSDEEGIGRRRDGRRKIHTLKLDVMSSTQ